MRTNEFIDDANRTLDQGQNIKLTASQALILHGAIGISTEANEILDLVKKKLFYGKEIEDSDLIDEIGDVLRYLTIFLKQLNTSFEDVMEINVRKMAKRYPEGFNKEKAVERNVEEEKRCVAEEFRKRRSLCINS